MAAAHFDIQDQILIFFLLLLWCMNLIWKEWRKAECLWVEVRCWCHVFTTSSTKGALQTTCWPSLMCCAVVDLCEYCVLIGAWLGGTACWLVRGWEGLSTACWLVRGWLAGCSVGNKGNIYLQSLIIQQLLQLTTTRHIKTKTLFPSIFSWHHSDPSVDIF